MVFSPSMSKATCNAHEYGFCRLVLKMQDLYESYKSVTQTF